METIVRKERTAEPPYSLHDAYLMELVPEGDSVRLCFQGGYLRVDDPCQVDGMKEAASVAQHNVQKNRGTGCNHNLFHFRFSPFRFS